MLLAARIDVEQALECDLRPHPLQMQCCTYTSTTHLAYHSWVYSYSRAGHALLFVTYFLFFWPVSSSLYTVLLLLGADFEDFFRPTKRTWFVTFHKEKENTMLKFFSLPGLNLWILGLNKNEMAFSPQRAIVWRFPWNHYQWMNINWTIELSVASSINITNVCVCEGGRVSVSGNDVTSGGGGCGERVLERKSRDCTSAFNSQLDAVRSSRHKFFTGVDVEIIRSVCR